MECSEPIAEPDVKTSFSNFLTSSGCKGKPLMQRDPGNDVFRVTLVPKCSVRGDTGLSSFLEKSSGKAGECGLPVPSFSVVQGVSMALRPCASRDTQ